MAHGSSVWYHQCVEVAATGAEANRQANHLRVLEVGRALEPGCPVVFCRGSFSWVLVF